MEAVETTTPTEPKGIVYFDNLDAVLAHYRQTVIDKELYDSVALDISMVIEQEGHRSKNVLNLIEKLSNMPEVCRGMYRDILMLYYDKPWTQIDRNDALWLNVVVDETYDKGVLVNKYPGEHPHLIRKRKNVKTLEQLFSVNPPMLAKFQKALEGPITRIDFIATDDPKMLPQLKGVFRAMVERKFVKHGWIFLLDFQLSRVYYRLQFIEDRL
jgi:hypothetical protein